MVSIVITTHNAFRCCLRLFRSLPRTTGVDFEVVVVDNRSRLPTRLLVVLLALARRINRLCLLDRNTLFAEANNIGVAASSRRTDYVLLLNSDVVVHQPGWLADLVSLHARGATGYGYVTSGPVPRADGWCLLIDRDLYERFGLPEDFPWWWSVTRLEAELLKAGHSVQAIPDPGGRLTHTGAGSGEDWKGAAGMDVDPAEVAGWFEGNTVRVRELAR